MGLRLKELRLNPKLRLSLQALAMGDATGASAASAAPGTAAPAAASGRLTIRVLANDAKLLSLFTLMNQIDFTINTCEKKTADDAKLGQAWAIKKLRESPVISTLRRLLLAFKFILVNQRSQWEEAHVANHANAASASILKLE